MGKKKTPFIIAVVGAPCATGMETCTAFYPTQLTRFELYAISIQKKNAASLSKNKTKQLSPSPSPYSCHRKYQEHWKRLKFINITHPSSSNPGTQKYIFFYKNRKRKGKNTYRVDRLVGDAYYHRLLICNP